MENRSFQSCFNLERITTEAVIPSQLLNDKFIIFLDDIVCKMCNGIITPDHAICSTCSKPFCGNCFTSWKNTDKKCPYCESTLKKTESQKILKNMLSKLTFNCMYKCGECIPYEKFISHMNSCKLIPAFCTGCHMKASKEVIESHCSTCKAFIQKCHFCKNEVFLTDEHYHMCPKYPVKCPLCSQTFDKDMFVFHNKGSCFERIVLPNPIPKPEKKNSDEDDIMGLSLFD